MPVPVVLRIQRLRALRLQKQMSQAALAAMAGVSQPVVNLCEHGWASANTLEKLARVLDVAEPRSLFDVVEFEEARHLAPALVMEHRDVE
jgi:transcriptional regulator with XRE-family HTH domain